MIKEKLPAQMIWDLAEGKMEYKIFIKIIKRLNMKYEIIEKEKIIMIGSFYFYFGDGKLIEVEILF